MHDWSEGSVALFSAADYYGCLGNGGQSCSVPYSILTKSNADIKTGVSGPQLWHAYRIARTVSDSFWLLHVFHMSCPWLYRVMPVWTKGLALFVSRQPVTHVCEACLRREERGYNRVQFSSFSLPYTPTLLCFLPSSASGFYHFLCCVGGLLCHTWTL